MTGFSMIHGMISCSAVSTAAFHTEIQQLGRWARVHRKPFSVSTAAPQTPPERSWEYDAKTGLVQNVDDNACLVGVREGNGVFLTHCDKEDQMQQWRFKNKECRADAAPSKCTDLCTA